MKCNCQELWKTAMQIVEYWRPDSELSSTLCWPQKSQITYESEVHRKIAVPDYLSYRHIKKYKRLYFCIWEKESSFPLGESFQLHTSFIHIPCKKIAQI